MDQNALIAVVVFGVLFAVVFIADIFKFYAFRATLQPVLDAIFPAADRALAGYGAQLKPANEVFAAVQTLLDSDTDTLVKVLPVEATAQLRLLLETAQALTDGEIDPGGGDNPPIG